MLSVARATGQSVRQIAGESWALTVWTFLQVSELEEIERIYGEGNRIDLAGLVGLALMQPSELHARDHKWRQKAQLVLPNKDAIERGLAMARRIRNQGVLN
jgi:hypothetical protein